MKLSYGLMNFYYAAAEFLKTHAVRLIILSALFVVACAIGIKSGCGADAVSVLQSRGSYRLLVGDDTRSVVGFLFSDLAFCLIVFLLLALSALNFWIACLGFAVFFYVVYTMGYTLAVYFICFKFAALPYLIVCYVPYCFIISFSLACVIVTAMDCGMEMRRMGYFCFDPVKSRLSVFCTSGVILIVGVVYGGAVGGLLTSGLII